MRAETERGVEGASDEGKRRLRKPKVKMADLATRIMASSAGDNYEQLCIKSVFDRIRLSSADPEHLIRLAIPDAEIERALPFKLVENLRRMNVQQLLPAQRYALPLLADHDVDVFIGAATGNGKTLGFLIPIAVALLRSPRPLTCSAGRPRALVIANTQVLQVQTYKVARALIADTGLRVALVVGEMDMKEQEMTIQSGVDIVIATPGRLLDMLQRGVLVLSELEYYIYDEADKMTQAGAFKEALMEITHTHIPDAIKPRLRSCFFTATLHGVTTFDDMFREGRWVAVEVPGNPLITHQIIPLEDYSEPVRRRVLMRLLLNDLIKQGRQLNDDSREKYTDKTVVFVEKKVDCNFLTAYLQQCGFSVGAANGNLSFSMRTDVIDKFVDGRIQALIATDSMARGHDIPGVSHVIIYHFGNNLDTFKHQSGRTARIGNSGTCTTLLPPLYFRPSGMPEEAYFPSPQAVALAHYLVLECGQRLPECMRAPALVAIANELARWGKTEVDVEALADEVEAGGLQQLQQDPELRMQQLQPPVVEVDEYDEDGTPMFRREIVSVSETEYGEEEEEEEGCEWDGIRGQNGGFAQKDCSIDDEWAGYDASNEDDTYPPDDEEDGPKYDGSSEESVQQQEQRPLRWTSEEEERMGQGEEEEETDEEAMERLTAMAEMFMSGRRRSAEEEDGEEESEDELERTARLIDEAEAVD